MTRLARRSPLGMPLVWRVFAINAAVLLVASATLLLSPVTVSSPVVVREALIVVAGLCLMLILTLLLLRRAFAPLEQLAQDMGAVDLLRPGVRAVSNGPDAEVNVLARAFNAMLERLERERRLSSARAVGAQEEERRRVARELHDHVGQVLTGVLLHVQQTTRDAPEATRPALEEVSVAVREALEDVRRIARELRPEALDDLGLPSALNALAANLSRHTDLHIKRSFAPDLPDLGPARELAVYRVAQESLTNVVRHARAENADLRLGWAQDSVVLTVSDDGCGIDGAESRAGGGLRGMRERALAAGAELSVESGSPAGTSVRMTVPVDG